MFQETAESVAAQIAKGGGAVLMRGGVPIGSGRWVPVPGPGEAGAVGAQLAVRADQPRLVDFYAALGYSGADDVELTAHNPLSLPPFGMRKIFKD